MGAYPVAQAVRELSQGSRGVGEAPARGEEQRELGRWRGDPAVGTAGSSTSGANPAVERRAVLGSRRRCVAAAVR